LVGPDPYEWLVRSRNYLAEHYSERVTLQIAAQEACLSPFHFHRKFQTAFGETPHEFLTRRRLEQAKSLLRKSDLTVSEICLAVGYESLGTFSSTFARRTGQAPTEFRRVFSVPGLWALKVVPHCYLRLMAIALPAASESMRTIRRD
jgi:AraC-like DNA-binding protein